MVRLISKLGSGLWVCPENIFSFKNIFLDLRHTASFIIYTFLCIFHIKPCSQVSCMAFEACKTRLKFLKKIPVHVMVTCRNG